MNVMKKVRSHRCVLCHTPLVRKTFRNGLTESAKAYRRRRHCDLECLALDYEYSGSRMAHLTRALLARRKAAAALGNTFSAMVQMLAQGHVT